MTNEQLYCDVADCDDPENPGFPRPVFRFGKCSSHCKQLQRTGETTTISEKLPIGEQLVDAYGVYAEADDDDEAARARRHFLTLAKRCGRKEVGEAIRQALARARANGKRIGRPPKAESARVLEVYEIVGSARLTAQLLGIHRVTVFRYLKVAKGRVSLPVPSSPRRTG